MRSSEIAHPGPTTPWLFYWAGWLYFKLLGWDTEGEPPQIRKGIVIAAPHTTNWDLTHMLAASFLYRFKVSWLGKDTLFWGPFGWFFRALGGVPVNRRAAGGLVGQVSEMLKDADQLMVAVPPSGTRKKSDRWKSGFYWMAHGANVPIVCGSLDYKRKRASLSHHFLPTGDVPADMDAVRAHYDGMEGKYPECHSTIRLKEEVEAAS